MQREQSLPQGIIGTWRRFGLVGPVYIIGKDRDLPNGDSLMRIRVIETGEELAYKLTNILTTQRSGDVCYRRHLQGAQLASSMT